MKKAYIKFWLWWNRRRIVNAITVKIMRIYKMGATDRADAAIEAAYTGVVEINYDGELFSCRLLDRHYRLVDDLGALDL